MKNLEQPLEGNWLYINKIILFSHGGNGVTWQKKDLNLAQVSWYIDTEVSILYYIMDLRNN